MNSRARKEKAMYDVKVTIVWGFTPIEQKTFNSWADAIAWIDTVHEFKDPKFIIMEMLYVGC